MDAGGSEEDAGGLKGLMKLMLLQTENINKFVEAQTDNLSRTTGVTKRVPPVFTANTPDILYDEIRAVQLQGLRNASSTGGNGSKRPEARQLAGQN